jgi:hypothetical protein
MSIAEESLRCAGLFEAEALLELMLRLWNHPQADDQDFRNDLLESATEALELAVAGQSLLQGLPSKDMNLIAAIWYVESNALTDSSGAEPKNVSARKQWLERVRHTFPSCFCDPADLG